jgi:hypothetical protein
VTEHRNFRRSFGSLADIFAFSADFFARHGVDAGLLSTVDFTLEELFTNMVKYSPRRRHVRIDMAGAGGVEVTLTTMMSSVSVAGAGCINLPSSSGQEDWACI